MYIGYAIVAGDSTVEVTDASNNGNIPTDPTTGEQLGEIDPVWSVQKNQYLLIENAFSGDYNDLVNKPDLTAIDGKDGAQGPQGIQGIQGLTGLAGPAGINGSDGFSPTITVTDGVLAITNIDGSISTLDINAIVATQPPAQKRNIWAVVNKDGNFIKGEGIKAASVKRLSRGVYSMCVEDTTLTAPLALQVTAESENENAGSLMLFSTTQINQPNGCFKVFGRGVTGGSEHWDIGFNVIVKGNDAAIATSATEIARITIGADAKLLTSWSASIGAPTSANAANETHWYTGYNKTAWVIYHKVNLTSALSEYYIESLTPGMDLEGIDNTNQAWIRENNWSIRCFSGGSRVDCKNMTVRLMKH